MNNSVIPSGSGNKILARYKFIIFLVAFGFSVTVNLANIYVTQAMYGDGDGILFNSTLYSPDNDWYLNQIKNYLNSLGFTIDPLDPVYAVRRTPGYPLFYGLHYLLFGEAGAHLLLPYSQTFLHALAAVYFFKTALLLFSDLRLSFLSGILYGISPFVVSFLYMTITESIFPAMIIFALYLIVASYVKRSLVYSSFAGIMLAAVVLVSPRTGLTLLFLLPLIVYFKTMGSSKIISINLVLASTFIIAMSPWAIRNYILIDKFIPLETYYLNHTIGGENMKNLALYRWWSNWGSDDRLRLHWDLTSDISTDNPYKSIDAFVENEVPAWVYNVRSKTYLRGLLHDYQNCIARSIELNGGRRLRYLEEPDPCEYQVSDAFDSFAEGVASAYPLQAYIVSPLYRRGSQYIFHSAIHNWRALDDYRSNPIKFVLKGLAYVLNVLLWLLPIGYFMSSRTFREKMLLGIVPVFSFLVMVYYRHVEGRYLLGIYPFLYLMTAVFFSESLAPFLRKFFSRTEATR